ncbi:hypothetical protein Cgig2_022648 [Carnegiea gigantea]|uniref:Uncharacterized protein n=1 Tax=Carnegiea gigantea TaxID=171969 RepID=A0A9Q1JEU1_9CARY|nr:hypothetical protein Cgig2_022648 [Carnegiea gigantea]
MRVRLNYLPVSLEQRTFIWEQRTLMQVGLYYLLISMERWSFIWSRDLYMGQAELSSYIAEAVDVYRTFMNVTLNYLPMSLVQRTFMRIRLISSTKCWNYQFQLLTLVNTFRTFPWVRLNYLLILMEQGNSMWVRLSYLPISLEQRPLHGSSLIIFLYHWSNGPLCQSSLSQALLSSCNAGAVNLDAARTFMPVMLHYLPVSLEQWIFMWARLKYLPVSLEQRKFIWVRLNYLLVSLKQRAFILHYLPVSLEQQTFTWFRLNYLLVLLDYKPALHAGHAQLYSCFAGTGTFMQVRLNYLPISLEQRIFMLVRLKYNPISLEKRTYMWVTPNYLPVSLERQTFMWVRLNYLPISLEQ